MVVVVTNRIQAELTEIMLEPPFGIIAAPKDCNMYFMVRFFM